MATRSFTLEPGKDIEAKAAAQLERILASKAFRRADRLKRFLTFVVEETVAGEANG